MLVDLSRPAVMAIINVTPDSFYSGSRACSAADIADRARSAVMAGASIIDVGGYSSRPGACDVDAGEELRRVAEGVQAVRSAAPGVAVSVDTFRAEVAAKCIERFGQIIINDISAGELDPEIISVAARSGVPYIAMHMRGTPSTMQSMTDYGDVTDEVVDFFRRKTSELVAAGMARENIIVDPGFGFAKTAEQNYELLAGLHRLCAEGFPVLAGVSRKSMIYKPLGLTASEALNGTTALHWECLRQGVKILRVHDVREASQTVRLWEMFERCNDKNRTI